MIFLVGREEGEGMREKCRPIRRGSWERLAAINEPFALGEAAMLVCYRRQGKNSVGMTII